MSKKPPKGIEQQVNEAFGHVSHGYSVTLPKLLAETRKRGLSDDDVKAHLQDLESNGDEPEVKGWRSGSGETFVQRNQCRFYTVASVNELFMELK